MRAKYTEPPEHQIARLDSLLN